MSNGRDYDNSFILFRNERKGGNAKAPDYRGNATVGGEKFDVSAWVKDGRNGKFLSGSFKPPYRKVEDGQRGGGGAGSAGNAGGAGGAGGSGGTGFTGSTAGGSGDGGFPADAGADDELPF